LADHRATVGLERTPHSPRGDDDGYPKLLRVVAELLDSYFNHRQTVALPVSLLTGRDLIHQFDLAQGPVIGRLLANLREAQATGEVSTREQAELWVRHKISEWGVEIRE
jgi:hypothetical protein